MAYLKEWLASLHGFPENDFEAGDGSRPISSTTGVDIDGNPFDRDGDDYASQFTSGASRASGADKTTYNDGRMPPPPGVHQGELRLRNEPDTELVELEFEIGKKQREDAMEARSTYVADVNAALVKYRETGKVEDILLDDSHGYI